MQSLAFLRRATGRRGASPFRPAALTAAVVLALAAATGAAHAQDALLDAAAARLAAHDAAGAFALLDPAEAQRAGEPRFDYLFGVAALDAGHVTRAVFALERLVEGHPDDTLAHAELGRAYLAAGDPDRARAELRAARAGRVPEAAAAAIDRVLGVIDQVAPPSGPKVSGYVDVGAGYDTNVNSATNQGEFAVPGFGGILFTNAPENRRRGDSFAAAGGGLNAQLVLSPAWKLVAAANLHATVDRVVDEMDTTLFDATLAATHEASAHAQTIALQSGTAWVGSHLYRNANGASAQWQMQLDAATQGSLFGQWSHQAYSGQPARDTNRGVVGLGAAHAFGEARPLVYGSAYVAREQSLRAQDAHFGHHATGLRLGMEQPLATHLVGTLEWQHELRRYGGTEPFFDVARRDRQDDVAAGVRWDLADRWQLQPQVRFTRGASNVVLYDYRRTVFQVTLHRSFP